ncbi:hypothetical protein ACFX2A_026061 [Malus domestica]
MPPPFVKINVAASWVESSRSGFVGLVARDSTGKFLAASRQAITALCVSQAEALALLLGCELGISQGFSCIILELDSLESVSCLNGKLEDGSWRAYPILAQVQKYRDSF